ncbi:hypothetical protein BH23ACI1_BH23ACI1_24200 [soil metagenome]|nr:hypothetical protein [Acidobacteriota bacterium]
MSHKSFSGTALFTATVMVGALASSACNRGAQETVPVAEMQTESPVHVMERPVSVQGCLRAGEGGTTFVLTSSRAEDDGTTATYALHHPADMVPADLREHVGQQVHVEGVVRAQQALTGYTPSAPPANDPVGTGGEPAVSTTTELAVHQLEIKTLRPLGEACGDDR